LERHPKRKKKKKRREICLTFSKRKEIRAYMKKKKRGKREAIANLVRAGEAGPQRPSIIAWDLRGEILMKERKEEKIAFLPNRKEKRGKKGKKKVVFLLFKREKPEKNGSQKREGGREGYLPFNRKKKEGPGPDQSKRPKGKGWIGGFSREERKKKKKLDPSPRKKKEKK